MHRFEDEGMNTKKKMYIKLDKNTIEYEHIMKNGLLITKKLSGVNISLKIENINKC